MYNQKLSLHKV